MTEMPKPLEELSSQALLRKQQIGRVASATLRYLTSAFSSRGFDWLLPVVLSRSTDPLWPDPDNSIEKRLEVDIYGETVRTMMSMIVHKQVACSIAYPRFFVLSPNVRIEKRDRKTTGWHAYEFTQFDFEIRGASAEEVMGLIEEILVGLIRHLRKEVKSELVSLGRFDPLKVPKRPFTVHDRRSLLPKYDGDEWEWETKLPQDIEYPVWVTNIPMEFYDFESPKSGRWDNYDLIVPRYGEILSGGRREWEYDRITEKLARDGLKKEYYALLLKLAQEGRLKPSAGAGIGLERLLTWIVGANHIGEVQPFPKVPGLVYNL